MDESELIRPTRASEDINFLSRPWVITLFIIGLYVSIGTFIGLRQCCKKYCQNKVAPGQPATTDKTSNVDDMEVASLPYNLPDNWNTNINIINDMSISFRRMSDILPTSAL